MLPARRALRGMALATSTCASPRSVRATAPRRTKRDAHRAAAAPPARAAASLVLCARSPSRPRLPEPRGAARAPPETTPRFQKRPRAARAAYASGALAAHRRGRRPAGERDARDRARRAGARSHVPCGPGSTRSPSPACGLYVDLRGAATPAAILPPTPRATRSRPRRSTLASLIERECEGRAADVIAHDTAPPSALTLALNHPERVGPPGAGLAPCATAPSSSRFPSAREQRSESRVAAPSRDPARRKARCGARARCPTSPSALVAAVVRARAPSRSVLDRLGRDALLPRRGRRAFSHRAPPGGRARSVGLGVRALTLVVSRRRRPHAARRRRARTRRRAPARAITEIAAAGHLPFIEQREAFLARRARCVLAPPVEPIARHLDRRRRAGATKLAATRRISTRTGRVPSHGAGARARATALTALERLRGLTIPVQRGARTPIRAVGSGYGGRRRSSGPATPTLDDPGI